MILDIVNLTLRSLVILPLVGFLIFQHNNRHLNGKFFLVRRFTASFCWSFIIYAVTFIVTRIINLYGHNVFGPKVQIATAVSHIISVLLLLDAGYTLKRLRNHEQKNVGHQQ